MSHTPPGVIWGPTGLTVTIQVRNAGKTPAVLTGLLLKTFLLEPNDQLPPRPDYSTNDPPEPQEGFLAAEDKIFVTRTFHLADGDVEAVRSGLLTLYLLGYVDYVDFFEKPHRAGYARVYDVGLEIRPTISPSYRTTGTTTTNLFRAGPNRPLSTASARPANLISQPHARRSDHQARADQQEGPYSLPAGKLGPS